VPASIPEFLLYLLQISMALAHHRPESRFQPWGKFFR
jgi:hypothetical protein